MTVPASTRRAGPFLGNGAATSFPFTFKTTNADEVQVVKLASGLETTLVKDSDYTVTLNADQDATPGGTITYPITGAPLAAGQSLTIAGAVPYSQDTDLPTGGKYAAQTVEGALDRAVIQIQQLAEENSRSLRLPLSSATASTELPGPQANKLIGWDASASGLQNVDPATMASIVAFGTADYLDTVGDGTTTVFTLPSNPGALANLDVSVGGVTQRPVADYTLSGTTLTFTSAPPIGVPVFARYMQALPQGVSDAGSTAFDYSLGYADGTVGKWLKDLATSVGSSFFGWIQAGAGAVLRTLQDKGRDAIHAADFGAVGAGDETAKLLAAFTYALAQKRPIKLRGAYTVSGPITPGGTGAEAATGAAGDLHIECDGDVTITVSGGASPFQRLMTNYTTGVNSCTIKGGRLTLDLANRAACGLYLRHSAGVVGGTVDLGPLTVLNVYEATPSLGMEMAGVQIFGRYQSINLDRPHIDGVDRTTAGFACKGISISDASGPVTINSPYVARVKCTPAASDADGISVFGYASNGTYGWRGGMVQINNPTIVDCQGRSIKAQASDVVVYRPRVYRQNVVSISTAEFDFQVGGDVAVLHPYLEYRKNGATSPLAANFYPLSFQARNKDRANRFVWKGGTLRSEVAIITFGLFQSASDATETEITVDGLECQGLAGLGAMFSTCFVNPYVDQIQTAATKYHIDVRNVRGNVSGVPWIGTSGATSATAANFSWSLVGNENTGALSSATKPITTIGGLTVNSFGSFLVRDNIKTSDYMGTLVFDYQTLPVGSRFTYDTATSTATNKPAAMGAVGAAFVEVLGQFTGAAGYRSVRVTLGNASAANTCFYTQDGVTWGSLK